MGADPEIPFYDVDEPRGGSLAFLDAALGYYDVLGTGAPVDAAEADEYDQARSAWTSNISDIV
jgi:hypothetical protein